MKSLIFILAFFPLLLLGNMASEDILNISSGGNFAVAVGNGAGHHVPAVDFFRRLERVVRRLGRIEEGTAGRSLLLVLDEKQPSGSCRFEHSRKHRRQVLKLPADYTSLLDAPAAGRVITSALIQSRLGNPPQEPLPKAACWIADGLWAEFVQRETNGMQVMRFTWLPELRNVVENGGKLHFSSRSLAAPENIRGGSAEWSFYCQKARLMLEAAHTLGSVRSNLLKDYCFLLFGKQLTADDCFDQTFGAAARRKIFTPLTPPEIVPADEKTAGRTALERLALKTLYSQYVPMSPAAVSRIFEKFCRISFKTGANMPETAASITDLPFLIEKYASTTTLPRLKIFELNELAAIAPAQLRADFYQLSFQLTQIGSGDPDDISYQMKKLIDTIQQKLLTLQKVDAVLAAWEKSQQPLLWEQRFFMNEDLRKMPLPENIRSFWDTVERSLQR